jgi:hypothetical protein
MGRLAGAGFKLGVCSLASGIKLYLECDADPLVLLQRLRESPLLGLQWQRVGDAFELQESLRREARWSRPDAWLIVYGEPRQVSDRIQTLRANEGAVPIIQGGRAG